MSTELDREKFPDQDAKVVRLVDRLPWGSLWDQIPDLEMALRCLLHAVAAFAPLDEWEQRWEEEYGYGLELTPEEVNALPGDARLALVADLVRWLDITYSHSSIATLVRGLNEIVNVGDVFDVEASA